MIQSPMNQATVQGERSVTIPPPTAAGIRTEDLHKTYTTSRGDVQAVRGISLHVAAGEFFGLLGPNGAGKSTTIGMLTTLIVPTGGHAWVSGRDVVANPVGVKRTIGVVPQNNTLDMQLSVSENLEFRSRFFGLGRREALRRADQLITAFGLTDRRRAMATDLSGGQARRLMIARALVHRPDVLFLDKPTAGLDPQTRVKYVGHAARAARQGPDHPADHALHGGSRGALQPGRGGRSWPDPGVRHRRPAEGRRRR